MESERRNIPEICNIYTEPTPEERALFLPAEVINYFNKKLG